MGRSTLYYIHVNVTRLETVKNGAAYLWEMYLGTGLVLASIRVRDNRCFGVEGAWADEVVASMP
jgi:hypothetical protein